MEVTPNSQVEGGVAYGLVVFATSTGDPSRKDALRATTDVAIMRRSDLMIRTATENAYGGNNVYNNDATNQWRSQSGLNGTALIYPLQIQNDGNARDRFLITALPVPASWQVRYYDALTGGNDVTSQVLSSGWTTDVTPARASREFRVEVTPAPQLYGNSVQDVLVQVASVGDPTSLDTVKAVTAVSVRVQPDLTIRTQQATQPTGDAVYVADPLVETVTRSVRAGSMAIYVVELQNDGNLPRTFVLKAEETAPTGWTVAYRVPGMDITRDLKSSAGWTSGQVRPGSAETVTLDVMPRNGMVAGASNSVTIKVYLDGTDKTVRDAVRAITRVSSVSVGSHEEPVPSDVEPVGAEVCWLVSPPGHMAVGMNYMARWAVTGRQHVSHTYVVMSTNEEPTREPLGMTVLQSGKAGQFQAWVPAPSQGGICSIRLSPSWMGLNCAHRSAIQSNRSVGVQNTR